MAIKIFKFIEIEEMDREIKSLNDFLSENAPGYEAKVKNFLDIKYLCLCKKKVNFDTINIGDSIVVKKDAQNNIVVIKLDCYDIEKLKED